MGAQRRVPHPVQKHVHRVLRRGRAPQHLIGDAGDRNGFSAQRLPRLGKGRKLVHYLPAPDAHRADLNNGIGPGVQAGGLQIKGHKLPIQRHVPRAMDRSLFVHIVLIVCLHPVEHLDLFSPAGGVIGVREGLHHPMIGDGDCRMAPFNGPLHHRLGVAQRVHGGHFGVQVKLHPLVRRGVLPPRLFGRLIDAIGLQYKIVIVKPAQGKPPLNLKPLTLFYLANDRFGLFPLHKPGDPDGAGQVGDIEAHHPGPAAGELPVLHIEDLALHQHAAHIQRQLVHGHRLLFPADLAVDLLNPLFPLPGSRGIRAQQLAPHSRHLGLQIPRRRLGRRLYRRTSRGG